MPSFKIYPCGDQAITIELGDAIDVGINQKVISLFSHLRSNPIEGIKDIIPSYHTVTVVYDLLLLRKNHVGKNVHTAIHDWVLHAAEDCTNVSISSRLVRIPVCYDPALVSDIAYVAELHGMHIDDVAELHASRKYRVYLVGFLPGFPYMGSIDKKMITPRKVSPRVLVPAGSVGIAGEQTGIYPFDSPGGWQILGQTPVPVFDKTKEQPCLLQPGDEVEFYPISVKEFNTIKNGFTHS